MLKGKIQQRSSYSCGPTQSGQRKRYEYVLSDCTARAVSRSRASI